MANFITSIRIVCSMALLVCPALTPLFYTLYIVAGLSDILDGWVARRTNTASDFGAKWDTVADFVFVAVCLIKLLPVLTIPLWLYIWIGVIAAIKIFNIVYGYVALKRFAAIHSVMNKVTGAMLFVLPLTLTVFDLKYSGMAVCTMATLAAVHEGCRLRHIATSA